jgi:hypothetical protein
MWFFFWGGLDVIYDGLGVNRTDRGRCWMKGLGAGRCFWIGWGLLLLQGREQLEVSGSALFARAIRAWCVCLTSLKFYVYLSSEGNTLDYPFKKNRGNT